MPGPARREFSMQVLAQVPKILRLFVEFLETDKSNDYGQARERG